MIYVSMKDSMLIASHGRHTHPAIADDRSLAGPQLQDVSAEQLLTPDEVRLHGVELFLKGVLVHALRSRQQKFV